MGLHRDYIGVIWGYIGVWGFMTLGLRVEGLGF